MPRAQYRLEVLGPLLKVIKSFKTLSAERHMKWGALLNVGSVWLQRSHSQQQICVQNTQRTLKTQWLRKQITHFKNGQKIWTGTSPMRRIGWQTGTRRDVQHHWPWGKHGLEPRWGNIALVRMTTVESWYHQVLARTWRSWSSQASLVAGPNSMPSWQRVWQVFVFVFVFTKLYSPHSPAISFFGMYPRRMKSYVHRKICTRVFKIVLFIMAPNWKQPKCPSAGESR